MSEHDLRMAVYCQNFGSLLGYAIRLNASGYYHIGLYSSAEEMVEQLENGRQFRYLIFDGFDIDDSNDVQSLEDFAAFEAIENIVLISDVNSVQRSRIFRWARDTSVPLCAVLQAPLRDYELAESIGCGWTLGAPQSRFPEECYCTPSCSSSLEYARKVGD